MKICPRCGKRGVYLASATAWDPGGPRCRYCQTFLREREPAPLDLMRKLLEVREERGAAPGEARAARRQLSRLLALHGLSEEDVRASASGEPSTVVWPFGGWPWERHR